MDEIEDVPISTPQITLGQLLKLTGLADTGGAAKHLLAGGVQVNGRTETRRGAQLRPGDVVRAAGRTLRLTDEKTAPPGLHGP